MSKIPKKAWRDAATLIIAGRNGTCSTSFKNSNKNRASSLLGSRESTRHDDDGPSISSNCKIENSDDADFDILLLKRSSSSRFMPKAYVFPGGVIDQSDYSGEWKDVFNSAGFNKDLLQFYQNAPEVRPPLFEDYKDADISPDVAFRICALRETFEESGVLIVRSKDERDFTAISHTENLQWRKRVHNNAFRFLEMCKTFNFVPDIWSLTEWSNWLTPVSMSRRYDTIFYLCTLEYQPHIEQDNKETVHAQWSQPINMLQDHLDQKLWVAPPQAYELTRLSSHKKMKDLSAFAKEREKQGTERWLPFRYACNDCLLSILPGDDVYPLDPETEGIAKKGISKEEKSTNFEVRIDKSLEEFNKNLKKFNRMEITSSNHHRIRSNCDRLGHPPLNFQVNGNVGKMQNSSKL